MSINRTIIITFGHDHGEPPPCDYYVDLREIVHPYETDKPVYKLWEEVAKHIIGEIEPGSVVALGCEDGDDRSVHIARLIQKHMDNVVVVDRDLGPDAGKSDSEKDDASS